MTTQPDRTSTGTGRGTGPRPAPAPMAGGPRRPLARRLWRGRPEDPRWARPAFLALLLVTGLLYLYNLSASGFANSFYSAAVQAGSESWKAFLFGSLDAANAITVDKPPASLWPMGLSVRLFGLNSWTILVPEVLMGVGTVAVVYASVNRRSGPAAALVSGTVLALTPVAALMFRYNNPDAMLALLLSLACYLVVRSLEDGRTKWLVWAGAVIGLAFLAKGLQAFLILPVLALVYGVRAPVTVGKRLTGLAWAALALVVSGGWWVALVELWPASSRPYIGGSQSNSFLELTFGYNGLGRLNGEETGSVGGGGGAGGGRWGETGWGRMFDSSVGGQISWLLPAALILLVAGLVITRRAGRTDPTRGSFMLWGGSLLLTAAVFSHMAGIFHEYYTVALAPYIAALIGMGSAVLWERRRSASVSLTLAATTAITAGWGYVLLGRTPEYLPWLKWAVLAGGLAGALGLLLAGFAGRTGRRLTLAVAGLSLAAALAGPTAYTLSTVQEGHTGSLAVAGPAGAGGRGGDAGPGADGRDRPDQRDGAPPGDGPAGPDQRDGGDGGTPGRGAGDGLPGGGAAGRDDRDGPAGPDQRDGGGNGTPGRGGGAGGLLNGATVSPEAGELLEADADSYTWAAAAVGSQTAAGYQLATGEPVMAVGGFNGTDPSPTLAQFQRYVAEGRIHYFIAGGAGGRADGGGGAGRASGTSSQITSWVEENFEEVTVGSATFYDLTGEAGG
ncbi:glycosyltransferase family 39 protein [Streptomyces sp. CNQ085]|uniref:ArnT family glycosyltransferase n=1 Tax=Streptomyces sp. CNQ085 TaxID=2886944 RepID=UPI001F505B55|nr:glycosyltransferase family 39 protein [Streptomyces sp. CNQ085]MCI0386996.1 glycosyltransferase family 39 protein [Streptomyces sp. CNQ085]